jgi:hypothetical protein
MWLSRYFIGELRDSVDILMGELCDSDILLRNYVTVDILFGSPSFERGMKCD